MELYFYIPAASEHIYNVYKLSISMLNAQPASRPLSTIILPYYYIIIPDWSSSESGDCGDKLKTVRTLKRSASAPSEHNINE